LEADIQPNENNMKGLFNPAKINTVWALLAVLVLAVLVIYQVFMNRTSSDIERYIGFGGGIGLCVLMVILIYKFIIKNPHVVQANGSGVSQAVDISKTFQQVDFVSVLSEMEEKKKSLINQENWDELQKIQNLYQNLVDFSKQLHPERDTGSLRDVRQMDLAKANRLLTDLLTRIRK